MKRKMIGALLVGMLLAPLVAFAEQEINGVFIDRLYVDPTDVVVLTDTPNGCGSNFYHLLRTNTNFKEMYAILFLAFKSQTPINLTVMDECVEGDRKVISHGSMQAQ